MWPGKPITAHWSVADPVAVRGSNAQRRNAFANTRRVLEHRIDALLRLPLEKLDLESLREKLAEAGSSNP